MMLQLQLVCLALMATAVMARSVQDSDQLNEEDLKMLRAMLEEGDSRTAREWRRTSDVNKEDTAHKDEGTPDTTDSLKMAQFFFEMLAQFISSNDKNETVETRGVDTDDVATTSTEHKSPGAVPETETIVGMDKNAQGLLAQFKAANNLDKRALPKKPNYVFLLADDLGFHDIGFHNKDVISPNIDALAADGIQLENSYVQNVCSPSRHAILTGKYPLHSGMQHGVVLADHPDCSPYSDEFAPQALKKLGYATHMVGKWHLGFCNWKCTPTYRGFDTFYGFYQGYIDHYTHMYGTGYDWRDGEKVVRENQGSYATDLINNRAIEILKTKKADEPFYMYVSYNNVHIPLEVPQKYFDMYKDRTDIDDHRKTYLGMLTSMDDAIGDLVKTLKDQGLYENTIIIFTSDNGGESGSSNNFPLRGGKASNWEGGIKAAGFVHSPLLKKKGYKADQMIHATDWLPTMVSLAGGTPKAGLDGVDQTDFIINGGASKRDTIIHNIDDQFPYLFGRKAVRKGDWKLIAGFPGFVDGRNGKLEYTHRLPEYQAITGRGGDFAKRGDYSFSNEEYMQMFGVVKNMESHNFLFNIKDDPNEERDLAATNPDKVAELQAVLKAVEPSMVPVPPETLKPVPASDPKNYGGNWEPGWC